MGKLKDEVRNGRPVGLTLERDIFLFQRVHRDGRPLGPTLDETARRILGEIDRLDTIARAFSRFAAPAEGRPAPEPTPPDAGGAFPVSTTGIP